MKTINQMKNITGKALFIFLPMLLTFSVGTKALVKKNDTASFIAINGKIIDSESKKPIMYANAFIMGTTIGTVANGTGEFLLKIPKDKSNGEVGFSHLGYKTKTLPVSSLKTNETILLEAELVTLQEIIVRIEEPANLLKSAIMNIGKNYSKRANMITGFYRETVQQNKRYVSIAEAVIEAYKAPYDNVFQDDRAKILIGRKSNDVKKMDTIAVKLQGGPITPFYLDIAKNPENLVNEDFFKFYNLKLAGQVSLDNARCYVIEFEQMKDVNLPLYKGKFFIDVESLAIVALEYSLSEYGLPLASSTFVKRKPMTMRIDILGADYYIKYTKANEKWNLSYVRSELRFKCKWKKKLFSSSYAATSEMAVTDIDLENVAKPKMSESLKMTDVFSEKAEDFRNDDFWGDYNIIVPEEPIQNTINKLNKRNRK